MHKSIYILKFGILLLFISRIIYSEAPAGNGNSTDFFTYNVGVYISPSGSDYYEGTKERPLRTLKKAIDYIKISGKKNILLDSGTFLIDSTLSITEDIEILGASYWKEGSAADTESVIESWAPSPAGDTLVKINNAKLTLKGIVVNEPHRHFQNLFVAVHSTLICEKVRMNYTSQYKSSAIRMEGGILELSDTSIKALNATSSEAISGSDCNARVTRLEISGPQSCHDFTALAFTASSMVSCEQVVILPGQGDKLTGISLDKSKLDINNSTIDAGEGGQISICIDANASDLTITATEFTCKGIPFKIKAINAFASRLRVNHSVFKLNARTGLQAIYLNKGEINLQNSYFNSADTLEYAYAVNIEYAEGSCFNNIIECGNSADVINVMLSSSKTNWLNNTIIGGNGNNITVGFLIRGAVYPVIINNIISRKTPAKGIALYLVDYEEKPFYLLANNISGWEIFLKYTNVPGNKSYTAMNTVIKTIEELNYYDLVPFGGMVDINISEEYENTFQATDANAYALRATSRCIDAGLDVNTQQLQGPTNDYLGNSRPNLKGAKPIYDLGALEFF